MHRHHDHQHGDVDVEQARRVDRHLLEGVHRARHRGQQARESERRHLRAGGVDPRRGRRILVLRDRAQAVAEAAAGDEPHHDGGEHGQREEVVVEAGVARIGRDRFGADGGHGDAGVAAGEPVEVDHDLAHALGDAERGDREVVPAQAQHRYAHQHGEGDADRRGGRQRQPERDTGLGHQDRGRVPAEAEEDDVAEARVAGEAADQVPALGERDEHEHARHRALLAGGEEVLGQGGDEHESEHAGRDQRDAARRRRAHARGGGGGGGAGHQTSTRAS